MTGRNLVRAYCASQVRTYLVTIARARPTRAEASQAGPRGDRRRDGADRRARGRRRRHPPARRRPRPASRCPRPPGTSRPRRDILEAALQLDRASTRSRRIAEIADRLGDADFDPAAWAEELADWLIEQVSDRAGGRGRALPAADRAARLARRARRSIASGAAACARSARACCERSATPDLDIRLVVRRARRSAPERAPLGRRDRVAARRGAPPAASLAGVTLTIATWNLENLFLPGTEYGPRDQATLSEKLASLAAMITADRPRRPRRPGGR